MAVTCTGKMFKAFLAGRYDPKAEPGVLFDFRKVDDAVTVNIDGNKAHIVGFDEITNERTDEGSMESLSTGLRTIRRR